MEILRDGRAVTLSELLAEAFEKAHPLHGERTALYLVSLSGRSGLALARAVYKHSGSGPDPAVLLARALALGAAEPTFIGSASVDVLVQALESMAEEGGADLPDLGLIGWSVREMHRAGAVPVVLFIGGAAVVAPLDALTEAHDELALWALMQRALGDA